MLTRVLPTIAREDVDRAVEDSASLGDFRLVCPHCGHHTPAGIFRPDEPVVTLCEHCGHVFAMTPDTPSASLLQRPLGSGEYDA
jgi:uncharacterized protein (DUF983 family)